ncbi:cytochrome c oxidase subunit II [Halonotius roseus]|uniref:cytochrome-c oxidase n=1 Tax=Halonotius roseus TaxID=2511997 RepID=A0A544QRL6_9EURY|nr:cytochrome c oxidase subunit II [Halonotius roseus]TQQ82090.1 cytochrome c oxidase subunit II [Halonotius roseus]
MNARRLAAASAVTAMLVTLLADPVAAQSTSAELINGLNQELLIIGVPITLLVEGILLYAVIKFKGNDDPKPTKENRRLEITWTIATAVILLFVGVASYGVMADENVEFTGGEEEVAPEENDVLIQAQAYQWGWDMSYPGENVTVSGAGQGPTVVVPANQDIYVNVSSRDVIHGFHVPELGMKSDAIPDQTNYIKTNASETGTYQGYCSEYCGVAHSQMYFTVEVVDQAEYNEWLDEQRGS